MPPPEPFTVRMRRSMYYNPGGFGLGAGVVGGALFAVALGIPLSSAAPPGSSPWRMVTAIAVLVGVCSGVLVTLIALKATVRPPSGPVNAGQWRTARRLLRRGEGSDDPAIAELVVTLADQALLGLKWQILGLALPAAGLLCVGTALLLQAAPQDPIWWVLIVTIALTLALLPFAAVLVVTQTRKRTESARARCLPHLEAGR